jgi:Zinc finger, C3HC4 type (RING finger)
MGSYDMCIIKIIVVICISFYDSRREVLGKYGSILLIGIILVVFHFFMSIIILTKFVRFKTNLN